MGHSWSLILLLFIQMTSAENTTILSTEIKTTSTTLYNISSTSVRNQVNDSTNIVGVVIGSIFGMLILGLCVGYIFNMRAKRMTYAAV